MRKDHGRDRVLTDDEIVRFWHGCTSIGWPFGPLCKLLLLCGQRGILSIGYHLADGYRHRILDASRDVQVCPAVLKEAGKRIIAIRGHRLAELLALCL